MNLIAPLFPKWMHRSPRRRRASAMCWHTHRMRICAHALPRLLALPFTCLNVKALIQPTVRPNASRSLCQTNPARRTILSSLAVAGPRVHANLGRSPTTGSTARKQHQRDIDATLWQAHRPCHLVLRPLLRPCYLRPRHQALHHHRACHRYRNSRARGGSCTQTPKPHPKKPNLLCCT